MDTKEMTQAVRLRRWAEMIQARGESGQTIRTWCKENGIHEKSYYYWQRRLREAACEQLDESIDAIPTNLNLITTRFSEVVPAEVQAHTELPLSNQLLIEIGDIRITADSNYPLENLSELLRRLRVSC